MMMTAEQRIAIHEEMRREKLEHARECRKRAENASTKSDRMFWEVQAQHADEDAEDHLRLMLGIIARGSLHDEE